MENRANGWCFKGKNELKSASDITIRGVLNMLMDDALDAGDERPTVILGVGDPSAYPCFRTTPVAEDAIIDALRSAKFNGYAPTVGVLPARR